MKGCGVGLDARKGWLLDKERNGEKKVEKEKEIEKEKAEIAQKSTSIVLGYSSSIGMPHVDYKKVVLHNHKGKLSWLGHAFVAPNIVSLWNTNLTSL